MKKILSYGIIFYIFCRFLGTFLITLYHIMTVSEEVVKLDVAMNNKLYLILIQTILGIIAIILPKILEKLYHLTIPDCLYLLFAIFLYGSIFLGEVRQYYLLFTWWDILFHFISGILIGIIGLSFFIMSVSKNKALLGSVFVFMTSITAGVIWEIYEFIIDGLYGVNMQKFISNNGINLIGRMALIDTMHDLLADCYGAFLIAIISFIALKYQKKWLNCFIIKDKCGKMDDIMVK